MAMTWCPMQASRKASCPNPAVASMIDRDVPSRRSDRPPIALASGCCRERFPDPMRTSIPEKSTRAPFAPGRGIPDLNSVLKKYQAIFTWFNLLTTT